VATRSSPSAINGRASDRRERCDLTEAKRFRDWAPVFGIRSLRRFQVASARNRPPCFYTHASNWMCVEAFDSRISRPGFPSASAMKRIAVSAPFSRAGGCFLPLVSIPRPASPAVTQMKTALIVGVATSSNCRGVHEELPVVPVGRNFNETADRGHRFVPSPCRIPEWK
jgi:hypothetical protein